VKTSTSSSVRIKKPARSKHMEADLGLAQLTPESRKHAACVLEVLAGLRSPEQAALALGISLPTYFNLETRALRGLVHGCTPVPPGRTMALLKQVRGLEAKCAALEKQVGRYQALLRNAQRSAGLLTAPAQPKAKAPGKRRHKPKVRALRPIEVLQRDPASPSAKPAEPAADLPRM
jgi:hypothetical protein